MQLFLIISLLIVALLLVGIILIQQGKGAEMGASFGAGASNTLFGAPGAGNFLTKSTTILAIVFFALALAIGYLNSNKSIEQSSLLDDAAQTEVTEEGIQASEGSEAIEANAIPSQENAEISTEIPTDETTAQPIAETIDQAGEQITEQATELQQDVEQLTDDAANSVEQATEEAVKKIEEKTGDDQ